MLSIEAWFEVGLLLQFLNLYTNFSALPDFQTMPPAVALLGEIELMDGVGGHVPQDRAVASPLPAWPKRAVLRAFS
jgi:hypothetical protein